MLHSEIKYFMGSSITGILKNCANSYSNAWCENLLSIVKKHGAYTGSVVGQKRIYWNLGTEIH